jgi:hypothetical protein
MGRGGRYTVSVGNLSRIYHLEDLGVDGRMILMWVLKKWHGKSWTGLMWFRIGTTGGLL